MKLQVNLNKSEFGDRYVASTIYNPNKPEFGSMSLPVAIITSQLLEGNYTKGEEARKVATDVLQKFGITEDKIDFKYGRINNGEID